MRCAGDGWDAYVDDVSGSGPGVWQSTAPMYDVPLLPQWGDLEPFAMSSAAQFRPAGPPALESQTYADAVHEVRLLGSATGATRTPEQTEIARFWADGAGTYTPPGHWNQIAAASRRGAGQQSVGECAALRAARHRPGRRCHRRLGRRIQPGFLAADHRDSGGRYGRQRPHDRRSAMDPAANHALLPGIRLRTRNVQRSGRGDSDAGVWQPGEFRDGLVVPAGDRAFLYQLPTSR